MRIGSSVVECGVQYDSDIDFPQLGGQTESHYRIETARQGLLLDEPTIVERPNPTFRAQPDPATPLVRRPTPSLRENCPGPDKIAAVLSSSIIQREGSTALIVRLPAHVPAMA